MEPLIPAGSHIEATVADDYKPRRGDVVILDTPPGWSAPGQSGVLVKRVVAIAGDHVVCCDRGGRLRLDKAPVEEPFLHDADQPAAAASFDVTVPAGMLWVMGDNRFNSMDSAMFGDDRGFVPEENVVAVYEP